MPNLVGIGLSQVPTNSMLGGLAYQDPEHASIKNLDLKNLSQINSEIADTAVDVFVYDTRKDSDGGAWRKRTQNTSWYNETLGTATRGTRKEFPAVAVIVMQEGTLTIYDGDDPDLPMWMVFTDNNDTGSQFASAKMLSCRTATSIFMLNGMLMCGGKGAYHDAVTELNFLSDSAKKHMNNGYYYNTLNISQRETTGGYYTVTSGTPSIVNNLINDVAMTVLPNAPIDSATGLPVPTIAVATDGGVSVIKDDGNVFDFNDSFGSRPSLKVGILGNDIVYWNINNGTMQRHFNALLATADSTNDVKYNYTGGGGNAGCENVSALLRDSGDGPYPIIPRDSNSLATGAQPGMSIFVDGTDRTFSTNSATITDSRVAYVTSDYNTGWMHGDIKGAFLSDTDIEDGVELVSNGTFNTDTTGWTVVGGGSATVSSGQAQLTNDGTTNGSLDQTVTTVVGKTYEISANITPQGGGPVPRLYAGSTYAQVASNSNSSQLVTFAYTATSTSTIVSINANTNVNNAVTLADNVSMKLTNDVSSSNLISGATYNVSDRITSYSYTNGSSTLVITDNPATADGYVILTLGGLTASTTYVLTVTANQTYTPTTGYNCHLGNTADGTVYFEDNFTGTASQNITFKTASSGDPTLVLYSNYNGALTYTLDLRLAEFDRSVGSFSAWNAGQTATIGQKDGLAVYGTITKTPVATGAELVAYSGFSNSDYLIQPYNSDMQTGTGDFSVTCWFKTTSTADSYEGLIYYNSPGVINKGFQLMLGPTNTNKGIYWYVYGVSSNVTTGYITGLNDGQWHCAFATHTSSQIEIYVDGILRGTVSHTIGSINTSDAQFTVGRWYGNNNLSLYWWRGSLALVRHSTSIPSPEQVKKMYEDEKFLFQENAKATLYGSSDAVTALAYDEVTDQLHVGTSSGRSDFQGLRRINNTTTAVTTAISAHDEFIIEQ